MAKASRFRSTAITPTASSTSRPSAESFAMELELTRGDTRKGKLIGPTGKPVIGARTYGQTSRWGNVQTLDADSFEVYGLDRGHPRLVLFAHKGLHLVGSVVFKGDDIKNEAPLVVRMERAGSVKGRLVDEDGQPLAGAKLGAMTFDSDGTNLPAGPRWPLARQRNLHGRCRWPFSGGWSEEGCKDDHSCDERRHAAQRPLEDR